MPYLIAAKTYRTFLKEEFFEQFLNRLEFYQLGGIILRIWREGGGGR